MRVFIVEDEAVARRRLKSILREVKPEAVIAGEADSVKSAVDWLQSNPIPDLVLMDIELMDGQSFEIFEHVKVQCPVIFITAYDGFAIKAFKHNSIDYLLKPIVEEELEQSLKKLDTIRGMFIKSEEQSMNVAALVNDLKKQMVGNVYRNRFLIRIKDRYHTLEISTISWFYATQKLVMAHCHDQKEYAMDYSLEELEKIVNPAEFFRASRQYLIAKNSIHTILSASYGKLTVTLDKAGKQQVPISREKATDFKEWLSW
ncbi:LytTR family DNA-binding domain-containing protein [Rhodocytophaga aerolata]|uniref:LytTR family DNA-binding domain-containing protein n=1 Tax=Rhodocytophaga aerolata TaxID=455078 RepID=A0ABT8RJN6_9BACT|nr:LytTR family DNA-binding domain-containing protein [Rhodocytophaga aerolata]MDO1451498.1 LytTR family DNA-binding domain-containing protein [Rhodocytophaga aerolata]